MLRRLWWSIRRPQRSSQNENVTAVRQEIAGRWLRGSGIEIGALHQPLAVPAGVSVTYVDRMAVSQLRAHYAELAEFRLVEVDVVDDGEQLAAFADRSQDFVVANHFLEHCEDPIQALSSALRVLRDRGIVYLAVPDKERTFDRERPVTTIEHLERDHREGPAWSRSAHYREWAQLVDHADDVEQRAQHLQTSGYSIHFHVWTRAAFKTFLEYCRAVHGLPFELAEFVENKGETVVILRRASPTRAS